jgi:hypothetical protein
MFSLLGDAALESLTGKAPRKSRTPVRRHSNAAGRCEAVFWRGTKREDVRKIVLAAKRYELTTRTKGARSGALGAVALEVIEYLANIVDYRTGRLDPSIDTMMLRLKRSRDAIVRALKALRSHGFLDWLRRYVPTGNEGRGPQVKQASNAYRLFLPPRALRLLGRLGLPVPVPDDVSHRQECEAAVLKAHADSLPLDERVRFKYADSPLTEALARLGAAMMQRESVQRTESGSQTN